MRHVPVRRFAATLAIVLLAALSIGTIELALHLAGFPSPAVSGWRSTLKPLEGNQLGFRGRPIKYESDDTVILLVGDSQVEASACCAFGWMPERRLEHYLATKYGKKVKVFTLGASGYGNDQELLAIREYFQKFRADMLILWQTPSNDIWNNIFPTHMPANGTRKPTFILSDGTLQWPDERIGGQLPIPSFRLGALARARMAPAEPDSDWEDWLPASYQPLNVSGGQANQKWENLRKQGLLKDENLLSEKSHLAIYFSPRSQRMQYGLDLTRSLLRLMSEEASAHHAVFALFRPMYDDAALVSQEDDIYEFSGRYYRASRRQREENMEYVNAGFRQFAVPIYLEDQRVGPWDAHLNEHATDQAMEGLAAQVAPLIADKKTSPQLLQ
ncbi:hypothetical protein W02_12540 [Nitrospira sp. KM1]|uniref:hypothetical protein n=1 Tax=Nitrospira sp. KM1 TaxID=1936990 RepID=UPI0013A7141B|nr:hypothetical protein [Nitrospira sp. KM1]BCA54114.1 hypothetical protein W02_12540 [Nitrospira sp. KM1]